MHDAFTVGIPLVAIIAGILFNRSDALRLETRINGLHSGLHSLQSEMHREFYHTLGQHDARLHGVEKKMS